VAPGEIFGLLGPNGAGKTTTIRMLLDIIKPDGGQISLLGGPMGEEKKPRIGYLPEERGLYDDMTVIDTLVFLGQLKGLSRSTARERAQRTLRQVELWDARERKIEQLSRGMGQKAQFVAATMHEPDLLIIDEPFSGLDPVNTRLIKELLYGMQERGTTIIMSTHQMHRVEEMCERILLLNEGGRVLYGPLDEIRQRFAANAVAVGLRQDGSGVEEAEETLGRVPGVTRATAQDGGYRLLLERGVAPEEILERLVSMPEVTVERFERVTVSLDDIFVRVVKEQAGDEAADTEEDEKDKQSERKEGRQ
jgi:ABC-2 type transport system ATP-binding protein